MKKPTVRTWSPVGILLAALCFTAPLVAKVDVDKLKPQGYLSDYAGVVDEASRNEIENYCARVQQALGIQLAAVTIPTIEDEPIEDFGIRLFRHFRPGDAKTNQGALMILVIQDHKSDIEIGRGLEEYVNDGFAGGILRGMRPELRATNYGAAILTGLRQMASEIGRGKGIAFEDAPVPAPARRQPTGRRGGGIPVGLIVLGFFVLIWLLGRGTRGGGGGGSFLLGMLLGNLLGGGRGSGGWGGGGGFGGSDDSGGGGGFGGFGGGDAGGGGANSDW